MVQASWEYARQIFPLLLIGVLAAGFLWTSGLGIIPARWVEQAVSGNGLWANLFAAVARRLCICYVNGSADLHGLLGEGWARAAAQRCCWPGGVKSANMLVIRSVMGTQKPLCCNTGDRDGHSPVDYGAI